MIIILRRITEETTKQDIIDFIEPVLNGRVFQKKGNLTDIQIKTLLDKDTNQVEYHGIVSIEPDAVGARVVRKLNRKLLNDKRIMVREYVFRSWRNDPRIDMNGRFRKNGEKRFKNRRRSSLEEIKQQHVIFSSEKVFHRTL